MNSASGALVWELWRRNRWGFAVLLALLALASLGTLYVKSLEAKATRLQKIFLMSADGALPLKDLLANTGAESNQTANARIKMGGKPIYNGVISAKDVLSWSAANSEVGFASLVVFLNEQPLCERIPGNFPTDLTVAVAHGAKRSISFARAMERLEELTEMQTRAAGWREEVYAASLIAFAFSVLVVFAIFGSAEPNSVRGFTGLPPRRFTLPVPTSTLVVWPLVLGAATMCVIALVWFGGVVPRLRPEGARLPAGYFATLFTAGLGMFQALVWGLPTFPKTRVTSLTLLMLVLVVLAGIPFEQTDPDGQAWQRFHHITEATYLIGWCGAAILAGAGVRLERQGRWSGSTRAPRFERWLRALGPKPSAFHSALRAQVWMEWRRNGRFALIILGGAVALILVSDLWLALALGGRWVADAITIPGVVVVICWIGLIGLNLARDAASKNLAMSSFTAVRPASTGQLFAAKLFVGGGLWLGAVVLLGVTWFVGTAVAGHPDQAVDSIYPAIALAAVSLNVAVGILPLSLTGRLPGFPWSLLPLLLVYGLIIDGSHWLSNHQQYLDWLFPVLVFLVILKLLCALWGFRRALALRLASTSFVATYTGFWLAAAGGLIWVAWQAINGAQSDSFVMNLIPAAALSVPLARIAISPLALAKNRHR